MSTVRRKSGDLVPATLVEDIFADPPDGAYRRKEGGYFCCVCPCGCGSMMNLPVHLKGTPKPEGRSSWEFNGDWDKPHLDPSIRDLSGCKFHGHLHEGVWSFLGDSGQ